MHVTTRSQSAYPYAARVAASPNSSEEGKEPGGPSLKEKVRSAVTSGATTTGGATVGYFLGGVAGQLVHNIGASARYLAYGPAVGAALGASWGLAASRSGQDDTLTRFVRGSATMTTGSTLGLVIGDALGHGLTALTGRTPYVAFGPLAGLLTGGLSGLAINRMEKQDTLSRIAKGAASTAIGATSGWFLGGGTSALIAKIAGNTGLLGAAPVLGLVSGALIGCAAYLIKSDAKPQPPQ